MLTTFEHDEYVFDALRHGASGFLLKNTPPAELLAAVRTVADGGALLAAVGHPDADPRVRRHAPPRAPPRTRAWAT